MDDLLRDVAACAGRYLAQLPERPVAATPEAVAALERLGGALPETGSDAAKILELLDEVGTPATVASAGPRYFGFVTGGALPASLAANWLAGAWDQNSFSTIGSPLGAAVDAIALEWLREIFGLPPGCGGALVTGATMANFTGLAAARQTVLTQAGWNLDEEGLTGAPPVTVVVGGEAHATLFRALRLLGFGKRNLMRLPVDSQGRMLAEEMPALTGPTIVCLQAGNVNTGAFDPAGPAIEKAQAAGAWVHVDGAFGLWAAAAPRRAYLMDGYDDADSWAVDGHKWLNVPYDCGIALVRRPADLSAAMAIQAAYLPMEADRQPIHFTPESSRRMRGLEVWAALKSLGRAGVAEMIERNCRQAARLAEGLNGAGFEILNEVVLNQVLVSFGPAAPTQRVIAAVQAEGTCWCGGTVWQGKTAMRISVSNWATTDADIERSLEAIVRVATAEIETAAQTASRPSCVDGEV